MANLKPVSPGQPLRFSASDYNAILETTRDHIAKSMQETSESKHGDDSGIILVKNNTAGVRSTLDILAIDVPLTLPTESMNEWRSRVALSCIAPGTTHAGRYVVLQEPIPAGKLGRAMVIGVTPVNLDVVAETDRFAEVADGVSTSLKTGTNGSARILWKESGTGAKRGVVMLTGELPSAAWNGPLKPDESSRIRLSESSTKTIVTSGWYWFVLTAGGGGGGGGDNSSTPVSGWYAGAGGGASGQRIHVGPIYLEAGETITYTHADGGDGGATSGTSGANGGNASLSISDMDEIAAYGGGGGGGSDMSSTTTDKSIKSGSGGVPGPSSSHAVHFPYPTESAHGQPGRIQYKSGEDSPVILNGGLGGSLEWPTNATNGAGYGGGGGSYNEAGAPGADGALDIVSTAAFALS